MKIKLEASQPLIDGRAPIGLSVDHQFTEIAIVKTNWHNAMARDGYANFKNDQGVPEIQIGVKEFKCVGAYAPRDRPYIYLNMGMADRILCPTCATLIRYELQLGPLEADPPDSVIPKPPNVSQY